MPDTKVYMKLFYSKEKALRCPKCHSKLYPDGNYRKTSNDWKCHFCKNATSNPAVSSNKKLKHPKRKVDNEDFFGRKKVEQMIRNKTKALYDKKELRNCALLAMLFLTGSRVSEIVGIRKKGQYIVQPLKKHQFNITVDRGVKIIHVANIPTLKKKKQKKRNLAGEVITSYPKRSIKLPYETEKFFVDIIIKYINNYIIGEDEPIFKISRERAWQICYYEFGFTFNHFYRHCRSSDLHDTYGYNTDLIKLFFKWTDVRLAERYTHIKEDQLLAIALRNKGLVD